MSRIHGPTNHDPSKSGVAARSPGTLGRLDAADPSGIARLGDTPGTLGVNDYAASLMDPSSNRPGAGRPLYAGPVVGAPDITELVAIVKSSATGRKLYDKARVVLGNKDPTIRFGETDSGGQLQEDGSITIDPRLSKCVATEVLVHELCNLSNARELGKLDTDLSNGEVSREDYIRETERIEFRSLPFILAFFDETKNSTKCGTCSRDYQRPYARKSFDEYFRWFSSDKYGQQHMERIGKTWDKYGKPAYEAKRRPMRKEQPSKK